jgi:RNA polymerase sigma factor (sigma-70 family)
VRRAGLPAGDLPDEALLSGFGDGDEELAVAFVRRFQSKVFGLAMAVTGDPREAEDVAQQVFERVWRHAGAFDPLKGSVAAWLATITRNLAIDTVRIRRPVPVDAGELLARMTAGASSAPDPSEVAGAQTSARALRAALCDLPAAQARAVVLSGIAGFSAREVAAAEGVPLGTAKTRIRTAVHRLRAVLDDREADRA